MIFLLRKPTWRGIRIAALISISSFAITLAIALLGVLLRRAGVSTRIPSIIASLCLWPALISALWCAQDLVVMAVRGVVSDLAKAHRRPHEELNLGLYVNPLRPALSLAGLGLIFGAWNLIAALGYIGMPRPWLLSSQASISLSVLEIAWSLFFIYLYVRESRYAWHFLIGGIVVPAALRPILEAYHAGETSFSKYTAVAIFALIGWCLHIRQAYFEFADWKHDLESHP